MDQTSFVTSRACRFVTRASVVPVIAFMMLAGLPAFAQTYSVLYNFGNIQGEPEGATAPGTIAQGRDGNIYTTSPLGGSNNAGTIYQVTPGGALNVVYTFDGTTTFAGYSGLTLGTDGNFYGTGAIGGGHGMIFKFTPPSTLTVLYKFTGGADGSTPYAAPIQGLDGNLYGTVLDGGLRQKGSVYKLTSAGKFTTLHYFNGTDGQQPVAPLVQGTDGNFYGTTELGGTGKSGTVFKITPTGKLTTLYNFDITHGQDAQSPLIQGSDGNFYGTTGSGGSENSGVIFSITPTGTLTVLHDFNNFNFDGYLPIAGLVEGADGNFYGAASGGGTGTNGTLYQITPQGVFTVLYNLSGSDGDETEVTPLQHTNGVLYGGTYTGGAGGYCTCGTFFSLNDSLAPFIGTLPAAAKVGGQLEILGQGFTGATAVSINGKSATFTIDSDTYMTATVPAGATTGTVTVTTTTGPLSSKQAFRILPTLKSFTPTSGVVGTQVTIKGVSLTQATQVTFGGVSASFAVNSDTQITATVPTGAVTGKIVITTTGGAATSGAKFTVTP